MNAYSTNKRPRPWTVRDAPQYCAKYWEVGWAPLSNQYVYVSGG